MGPRSGSTFIFIFISIFIDFAIFVVELAGLAGFAPGADGLEAAADGSSGPQLALP